MDPTQTQGVADWPQPHHRNRRSVSFVGFTGFLPILHPKPYSKIAKPLLLLTRKDTVWEWGEEQKRAFETPQNLDVSTPSARPTEL